LVDGPWVQFKEAGSVQADTVFRMTDYLPAGINVTERVEEIHGHIASAKSRPPEGKVLLVGEVRQNPLFDGMGKSVRQER
jgi:hypothetical protein